MNQTAFARHCRVATELLLDAMASPSQAAFDAAHDEAVAACRSAFAPGGTLGIEDEVGQSIARLIRDVARDSGVPLDVVG